MRIYIVQRGDTLRKIAHKHHTHTDQLLRLNSHIANIQRLIPGMKIILPNRPEAEKRKPLLIDKTGREQPLSLEERKTATNQKQAPVYTQSKNNKQIPKSSNKKQMFSVGKREEKKEPQEDFNIERKWNTFNVENDKKVETTTNSIPKTPSILSKQKPKFINEEQDIPPVPASLRKKTRPLFTEYEQPYYIPPQEYVCPCCLKESEDYRPNAFVYYSSKREV